MKRIFIHVRTSALSLVAFCMSYMLTISYSLAQDSTVLKNPVSADFDTIPKFIAGVLRVLVLVALPIIALFFVYSGFLFIKAQGNSSELETAKKNFVYVVIGAILILGAWVIAQLIAGTVTQLVTP